MLSKLGALLRGRATSQRSKGRQSGLVNRVSPGLEQLESRESPAYLSFGTAYVAGAVNAANSTSASSYYLPNGTNNGTLAYKRTSSLGEASASYAYRNNNYDTIRLELRSNVNTGNYSQGEARTNLTRYNNGGPGFVTVYINPSYGDQGQRVLVTLTASYHSNISGSGWNFTQIGFSNQNGQTNMLNGSTNVQGSRTYSSTRSFYATVGSSFNIVQTTVSWGTARNVVATGTANLTITVRAA